MLRRLLVIGGACAALAACGTGRDTPTRPAARAARLGASGFLTVTTHGRSATFPAVTAHGGAPGVALDRTDGSGSSATLPLAFVPNGASQLLARDGRYRHVVRFRDAGGARHALVALYGRQGEPPRAIQHYVDGRLTRVTAMRWRHTATGWAQERLVSREIRGDTLAFEAVATATTMDLSAGTRRVGSRLLAAIGAGLAHVVVPRDAVAQLYLSECADQYKKYALATAALTSAILAIEVGIDSGVGAAAMNALYFSYSVALAAAVTAEMDLYICLENARELDGGGSSTGGTSGGSGDQNVPGEDCLDGSYAAHCQPPYTL